MEDFSATDVKRTASLILPSLWNYLSHKLCSIFTVVSPTDIASVLWNSKEKIVITCKQQIQFSAELRSLPEYWKHSSVSLSVVCNFQKFKNCLINLLHVIFCKVLHAPFSKKTRKDSVICLLWKKKRYVKSVLIRTGFWVHINLLKLLTVEGLNW